MRVYTSSNECITLLDKAMSSGGQGEIHAVLTKFNRFGNICVKIYFKKERTKFLENKLKYMVANPPNQVYTSNNLIGWPLDVVYDGSRNFLGFVMPLAFDGSEPLIALTAKNLSKKLPAVWRDKFDRSLGSFSMINRLKLLCNIGIAIHKLHITNKYVIQDFKPENVLVSPDGKVSLVDMDSIQIAENGRMLYAGTGKTPNYMPPEHYTRGVGTKAGMPLEKSWDYFSVGVVFYQIIFGLHPYVVTPFAVGDSDCNEIYQNVAHNLFPFGSKASLVKSYPPLHNNFKLVPTELQTLFKNSFSDNTNSRPSLEQWVKTIKELIKKAPVPQTPQFGNIYINYSPLDASVTLDGKYKGKTPINIKARVGLHSVVISGQAGIRTYDVMVQEGETKYIHLDLKQDYSNGSCSSNNDGNNSSYSHWWILFAVFVIIILIICSSRCGASPQSEYDDSDIVLVDSVEIEELSANKIDNDSIALQICSKESVSFDELKMISESSKVSPGTKKKALTISNLYITVFNTTNHSLRHFKKLYSNSKRENSFSKEQREILEWFFALSEDDQKKWENSDCTSNNFEEFKKNVERLIQNN